ncbi:transposase [Bosea sp. RAF48]|uniref:transposase n=1 Tax=Bosea sp. RAF48 TaxID=3237480 RepID=UPI003F9200DD
MPNAVRMHDEQAAFLSLEALVWRDGPVCPHCGESSRLGRLSGLSTPIGMWKCYACRKPFTIRHGTIFQNSHVPMHVWLQALYLLTATGERISSQRLGQILGVSVRTAWHLKTKITTGLDAAKELPGSWLSESVVKRVLREPFPDSPAPLQPGQAVCKARYERFLAVTASAAHHLDDTVFLAALHRLLRGSGTSADPRDEVFEQQLELSLFDEPAGREGGADDEGGR